MDYQLLSDAERKCLRDRIETIRGTGVSTAVDESFIGLHDTAVLIGNPAVGVAAAIAVTQLTASRQRRRFGRSCRGLGAMRSPNQQTRRPD